MHPGRKIDMCSLCKRAVMHRSRIYVQVEDTPEALPAFVMEAKLCYNMGYTQM